MGERGPTFELVDRREPPSITESPSELEGAVDGRFNLRGRVRLVGEDTVVEILRSRSGSLQEVDEDGATGLVGSGGTAVLMKGSECCRRGFAASLLTRKSACSSTSRQRAQNSAKNLSSGSTCFEGWKFCVRE